MVIAPDQKTGTCEYCGSTMTLPKVDDDQRAAAFNRGNHFRRIGEFDKALSVYEGIVREDENDAEAHWCCALCRFGIEYVKDPASGEYLPTCHRASFDSFLEDVDYKAALEHADVVSRAQYQKDAEKIAQVQRGILSISQKEQPFDVFICYKETDENGQRTIDSTLAQDIYYQLTEQGRRVFFARITLEDKAGQEYEPYIFAALHSAKVMLVVGTKPEYLNAVWVKNEWSRYLALMKHDRKRLLIPCYRDMDPYDLPEQLSVLQSYDMSRIGFIQDLIRGIAKVLDADKKPEASGVKETVFVQGEGNVNLAALLKRGWQALEDENWETADGFFDQTLNIDAECGEAFFGKELANEKKRNRKAFIDDVSANEDLKPEMLTLPSPGQKVIKMTAENWKKAAEEATRMMEAALKKGETPPVLQTGETLEACPRDGKRIGAAIARYEVPGYLTKEEILKDFSEGNMRSYISAVSIRRLFQANGESRLKENKNLVRARRYAKGTFAQEFDEICREIDRIFQQRMEEAKVRDAETQKQIRGKYEDFLERAEKLVEEKNKKAWERREADYLAVCEKQEKSENSDDFRSAAENFEKLGAYKDCAVRAEECRKREEERRAEEERLQRESTLRAERLRKQKNKKIAIIASAAAVIVIVAFLVNDKIIQPSLKYKEAQSLLAEGSYEEAYSAFGELIGYKDVNEEFLKDIRYEEAQSLLAEGNYEEAYSAFGELIGYKDVNEEFLKDIRYEEAQSLLAEGNYEEAYPLFAQLQGYKDIGELQNDNKELRDAYFAVGQEVLFGNYEQDGNTGNGQEDIEWIVLAREGDSALLLSKYGLDAKSYNEEDVDVTWEQSDVRSWLNSSFMDTAFTGEEQGAILKTEVDNSQAEGNSEYSTTGGNNTEDRVFLLSYKEAFEDYFSSDKERICMPTDYAVQNGTWTRGDTGACWWWLRSPGDYQRCAAGVHSDGSPGYNYVYYGICCVRPALWINLESGIF